MVMKADHVTQRQLMKLIGGTLSKLAAGSQTEPGGNPELARAAKEYRPSVGIMLLNRNNNVFVGRRHNAEGKPWQMQQGGIDEGEEPRMAALRELKEEIGTDKAGILAESKRWLFYDFPAELIDKARHKGWRGQRQKWLVMRFKGCDADIKSGLTIPNSPIGSGSASNSFPTLLFRSSERSI